MAQPLPEWTLGEGKGWEELIIFFKATRSSLSYSGMRHSFYARR